MLADRRTCSIRDTDPACLGRASRRGREPAIPRIAGCAKRWSRLRKLRRAAAPDGVATIDICHTYVTLYDMASTKIVQARIDDKTARLLAQLRRRTGLSYSELLR